MMEIDKFDYDLPEELIAQTPLKERAQSKLMLLDTESDLIKHDVFTNISAYFRKGDCLVLNNSRVIPVRLYGVKEDTKAKIEILLLHETKKNTWEALVKPAKKVKQGTKVNFGEGMLTATCVEEKQEGARLLHLEFEGILLEVLEKLGEMPLPPYIRAELKDQERYQTVYAKENGSAAAPTAGLHFTSELLEEIKKSGVHIAYVTLHVGLGTFRPVTTKEVEDHHMHAEYYHVSEENAAIINETIKNQGRIFAVGTTSLRVLETIANEKSTHFKP